MKPWFVVVLVASLAGPALAADNHFPQPVQIADLIGQKLIAPRESQPLLGHIEAIDRLADGTLAVRIRTESLLPGAGRTVDVPLAATAYLGPQLALTGLTEAQLAALPPAAAPTQLATTATIPIDLVKPFH